MLKRKVSDISMILIFFLAHLPDSCLPGIIKGKIVRNPKPLPRWKGQPILLFEDGRKHYNVYDAPWIFGII